MALNVLQRALREYTTDDFAPWKWFALTKWYALAILLPEFCEPLAGPKMDRAWTIVEAAFGGYRQKVFKKKFVVCAGKAYA